VDDEMYLDSVLYLVEAFLEILSISRKREGSLEGY
jgi:hypothetical protein